jgi:phosphoketolase
VPPPGPHMRPTQKQRYIHSTATEEIATPPLSADELSKMDAYWRAANYLSVGQIYLYDNPLLKKPLSKENIKPRLLGHWGTTPGLNFIYVHLNRVITKYDLSMLHITGPGRDWRQRPPTSSSPSATS